MAATSASHLVMRPFIIHAWHFCRSLAQAHAFRKQVSSSHSPCSVTFWSSKQVTVSNKLSTKYVAAPPPPPGGAISCIQDGHKVMGLQEPSGCSALIDCLLCSRSQQIRPSPSDVLAAALEGPLQGPCIVRIAQHVAQQLLELDAVSSSIFWRCAGSTGHDSSYCLYHLNMIPGQVVRPADRSSR